MPRDMRSSHLPVLDSHYTLITFSWSDETEERRLVEEEGSLPKKTWLQKNEDFEREGELLSWAPPFSFW